jgi:Glycosyltransferases, probably involved in cell wall biogenesis
LIKGLLVQRTEGKFTFSITIVDNDHLGTARETVEHFQQNHEIAIDYFIEPVQSIALARNRSVSNAKGDFIAFIDDDEYPVADWLLQLYNTLIERKVDGVLGPVDSQFAEPPPAWMLKTGVFDRPNGPGYETGAVLDWRRTGTGNVLLRRAVLGVVDGPFLSQFGSGGEDLDFFRRASLKGKVFIWCNEALAHETVPVERTRVWFQLRRALLRGKVSLERPSGRGLGLLKSAAAFFIYTLSLPIFLVMGRAMFVKYLIKDFDHIGKLLAWCGIDVVRQKYVVK